MISPIDKVESIVRKEENAGYQHFFFSDNVFKRLLSQGRKLFGKELRMHKLHFIGQLTETRGP